MNIRLSTEHIQLSEKQHEYIEEKIESLKKYSEILKIKEEAVSVHVVVESQSIKEEAKHIVIKVTMSVPHAMIRAEAYGQSAEECVDLVHEKLKRQITRYKEKHQYDMHDAVPMAEITEEAVEAKPLGYSDDITKRKLFTDLYPMTEEQAIEQMNALEHTFFIFVNANTDRYNLVYVRDDNKGYGLVELEHRNGVLNG